MIDFLAFTDLVVGHPRVTERAYTQPMDVLAEARDFAEAICLNHRKALDKLNIGELTALKAQIERDYLVARMGWEKSHA